MDAAEEQTRLVPELAARDPAVRRRAAGRLLELSFENVPAPVVHAPIPSIQARLAVEEEASVRGVLALALLARAWKFKPLVNMIGFLRWGFEEARPAGARERAREAALACAVSFADLAASAPHLVPVLVDAMSAADLGLRKSAMQSLRRLQELGADITPAAPALVARLDDSDGDVVAIALRTLLFVAHSEAVGAAREAIAARLGHADEWVQYTAAQALVSLDGARGRTGSIGELLAHASFHVREGALSIAGALLLDAGLGPGLLAHVADRLQDPAGGVCHAAAKSLRRAAESGVDVAAAVPALEGARDGGPYSHDGWTGGPLDMTAASDMRGEWLGSDARCALVAHYLRAGDAGALARVVEDVPEGKDAERWPPRMAAAGALARGRAGP